MRILHITARADHSGGPRHVHEVVSGLKGRVDAIIACPREPPFWPRFVELVGEENVVSIPHRQFSVASLFALRDLCLRRKVDIVHSHGRGAGIFGRPLAALAGLESVHTFHGYFGGGRLRVLEERALNRWTGAVIAVSESEAERIRISRVASAAKLWTILNGVPVPELAPVGQARVARVVGIMRIEPQKEPGLFVDVCRAFEGVKPLQWIVLGDGSLLSEQRRRVSELSLTGVLDFVGPEDVPERYLESGSVMLATSRSEGLGLAMLEAMALGVPVVATRVPGHVDVITDGENGLLFEFGDAQAGAEQIRRLCEDPELYRRLGTAGQETVRGKFSSKRMVDELLQVYRSVCPGSR